LGKNHLIILKNKFPILLIISNMYKHKHLIIIDNFATLDLTFSPKNLHMSKKTCIFAAYFQPTSNKNPKIILT